MEPVSSAGIPWELRGVLLAAVSSTLLGLAIAAYGLSLPNALAGVHDYDDGVYLGAALQLLNGQLPYHDFVLLHPPGLPLLLAPVAAIGRALGGTRDALVLARLVTVVVAGLNCGLVAFAVRHRGAIASLAAGLALACFPLAVAADQTVLLEPYLAAACLVGTILAFHEGHLTSGRRLVWAGVAFGVAGAVKVWAVLPVVALLVVAAARLWRRDDRRPGRFWPLVGGLAVGFGLPCLPFYLAAPRAFVRDIVVDQLVRGGGNASYGLLSRLGDVLGSSGLPSLGVTAHEAGLVAGLVAAYLLLGMGLDRRRVRALDIFALLALAASVGAVLRAAEFYEYYGYFPVVFLAVCFGLSTSHFSMVITRRGRRLSLAVAVALLGGAGALVPVAVGAAHLYVEASSPNDPASLIDRVVPAGACALADESILLIASNRYTTARPACPPLVDSFGTWLAADPQQVPPSPASDVPVLAAEWQIWLQQAGFLVESVQQSDFIPWTPQLLSYFDTHYRLVASGPHAYVYRHIDTPAAVGLSPARGSPRP